MRVSSDSMCRTQETDVRYPLVRLKLLKLVAEDQADRQPGRFFGAELSQLDSRKMKAISLRDRKRADALLALLKQIKSPSVSNIGLDGAHAAWLIAQHNPNYRNLGPLMLGKMRYLYSKNKGQVYQQGIPYLVDRLMLVRQGWRTNAKQRYGTQGYRDENGEMRAYPIIDRAHLEERLAKFGLDLRACIGLSEGTPSERAE